MRTVPLILTVVAVVMLGVIGWRVTGGPMGPRSWAFIALTVAVIIAAAVSWRRTPPGAPGARSTTV